MLALDRKWYRYQDAKGLEIDDLHDFRRDIYDLVNNTPFDNSPLVVKTHHLNHKKMWSVPHSVFAESVSVEFEGELFSAPIGYDYYLKHRFGDYMQIPPENEQVVHDFTSFWKTKE